MSRDAGPLKSSRVGGTILVGPRPPHCNEGLICFRHAYYLIWMIWGSGDQTHPTVIYSYSHSIISPYGSSRRQLSWPIYSHLFGLRQKFATFSATFKCDLETLFLIFTLNNILLPQTKFFFSFCKIIWKVFRIRCIYYKNTKWYIMYIANEQYIIYAVCFISILTRYFYQVCFMHFFNELSWFCFWFKQI